MRELHTGRLLLRPLRADDRDIYIRLYTDPEVMRHIAAPLPEDEAGEAFQHSCLLGADPMPRYWIWVIEQHPSGQPVGLLGLRTLAAGLGEIGAMLLPPAQGQGHAGEAIARVVDYAFGELGFLRLITRHRAGHVAARKLMGGLGFAFSQEHTGNARWELHRDRWQERLRSGGRGEMEPPVNLC